MALSEGTTTEPGSIRDTANRLISWSRQQSWGLARVEYVSEFARERVLSSLRYALAEEFIPLHEIELPSYRSASEIVQFLVEQLNKLESGVVSVSGFATAFQPDTRLEDSLRILNFNRENLIPPTLRQIWWLPSSFAETFVPAVPDLDSWFTTRLYLTEGGPSPSHAPAEADYYRLNQLSNIPARNLSFTGREAVFDSIRDALKTAGIVVIHGIGGIGKTQTALEYAHRRRDDYRTLLWTTADNEDSLTRGLFRIAVLLDLPEVQETDQTIALDAARRWLQLNDDWLLILDELKDSSLLSLLLRNQKGHIVVTSRRRLHESSPNIDLSPMTPDDSRRLLFNRSVREPINEEDARAADDIAKEVGYHPLTLDLAGAYIGKQRISYIRYLMLYRNSSHEFQSKKKEPLTALTAVQLIFRDLNKSAQKLLKVCSFLNPSEIPLELLTWSLEILPKIDWDSSADSPREMNELVVLTDRYSLMHADVLARTCTMHPIIQASIRDRMNQSEQRNWAETAVGIVSHLFAYPEINWTQRERLLPSALAAAELIENWDFTSRDATLLLAMLGLYLQNRAQHNRAERLLRRALKIAAEFDEPDEPITITILEGLARLYYDEGRYKEAQSLLERALALQESKVGSENPAIAKSLTALARIELSENKYKEAESLLRRSLEIQRADPDQDPEEIITTIHYLAAAYLEQDRFEDAEFLFKSALEIGERRLGVGHPAITRILKGLARSYLGQDKYELAKPIYERILSLTAEQHQPREYAQSLTDMAYIYMREESYPKAQSLLQTALDIGLRTRNNREAIRTLNYLSWIYFREGRYEDAERSLREALRIQEELLGPSHPSVVTNLENYSMILRRLGRDEEAGEIEERTARMKAQLSTKENTL